MADKNFGVITEQGFPAGKFGFDKLNEADNAKIQNKNSNKDQNKK